MKRVAALAFAVLAVLPASASGAVLFREDFNGPADARPNQAIRLSLACPGRVVGAGQLRMETTPNLGASIGTFQYGTGWPPTGGIRASWSAPFKMTARLKMPTTPGVWTIIWLMSVDRKIEQGIWELDMAEPRSSL